MHTIGRRYRLPAAALALALGMSGCAGFGGTSFGPGLGLGLSLGTGPMFNLTPSTCMLQGTATPQPGMPMNAAAVAGARMQQVASIQSKFMMGNIVPTTSMQMASWRKAAEGGC